MSGNDGSSAIGLRSGGGKDGGCMPRSIAMIAEEVAVGQRKIPYRESRFSPRRSRKRDESAIGRHETLYKLGSQKQR